MKKKITHSLTWKCFPNIIKLENTDILIFRTEAEFQQLSLHLAYSLHHNTLTIMIAQGIP